MWTYLRQRPQQLARALARQGVPVYFVESPSSTGDDTLNVSVVEDNIFRVDAWSAEPEVTAACLHSLGELLPDAAWLIHHPRWVPLLRKHLNAERTLIYDCIDLWSEFPGSEWKISLWENELAVKADLVLASAMSLYNRMKLLNPSSVYLANAVYSDDYAHELAEADDLKGIPRPRLLFVGYIEEWVDLELVRFIAESRADWSIVMVGPSNIPSGKLPSSPNIYWLGKKPYAELGAYMHHCDVGLIPFKQTRLTRAVNPVKVHEYVACGLPVVSTFLPDVLLFEDPAVKVTTSYDAFVDAVETMLEQRPQPRGATGVQSGTWFEKAEELLRLVSSPHSVSNDVTGDQYIRVLSSLHAVDKTPVVAEELAAAHYASGNFDKAAALALPDSSLALAALVRQKRYAEARRRLFGSDGAPDGLRRSTLESLDDHSLAAYILLRHGDPVAALEELNNVVEYGPTQYMLLGRILMMIGHYGEALAAFSQVIDLNPDALAAEDFLLIGDACVEEGFLESAEEFYLHAFRLGGDEDVTTRLADLYLMRAQEQEVVSEKEQSGDRA